MAYAIEFRNGTYLQSLDSDRGGPKATAQKFDSGEDAQALITRNFWIGFAGGMVVPIREPDPK